MDTCELYAIIGGDTRMHGFTYALGRDSIPMPKKTNFVADTPIAQLVARLMEERGMNQSQVGKAGGISRSAINNIIVGKIEQPDLDTLSGLALAFDVDLAYIMREIGIPLYREEQEWQELAQRLASFGKKKRNKLFQLIDIVQD